jgi:hypothetical protein
MKVKRKSLKSSANPVPDRAIGADEIAVCAYALWELEGRPHGREIDHWLQAEAQLKLSRAHDGELPVVA